MSKKVDVILNALDIPKIDPEARSTLQRWVYRADKIFGGDRGDILLALRAIVESERNGPEALLEPILCAVHSACRPVWTNKGLAFIAAFDGIDLRSLLRADDRIEMLHKVGSHHVSGDRYSKPALGDFRTRRRSSAAEGQAICEAAQT